MMRQATVEDIPELARLRAAWTVEASGDEPADTAFEGAFRGWLATNPRTFFVTDDPSGHLIGMLNLLVFERMPKPGRPTSVWVYLASAYVLPSNRNAGVGGQLLEAALAFARSIGAARVVTAPSDASKDFYIRHGFEAAEELAVYRS